ncbi:MAG: SOS response-associated peptidase [Fimbriimonadales bacterium]
MCARFSLYATPAQIAQLLEIEVPAFEPHYNIAPTQTVLGAIEREGERQLREFRWGLIPSWAKDPAIGNRMINARSETILEKPAFRNAFQRRRCVIPANGFFEWKHDVVEEEVKPPSSGVPSLFDEFGIPKRKTRTKTLKQPFFVSLKSGEPFALAGLYEYWHGAGEKVRSCTILTTRPNELVEPLHDRMPVILRKADLEAWLDCEDGIEPAEALLEPLPASEMMAVPVSSLVNDPNNDVPEVLARI